MWFGGSGSREQLGWVVLASLSLLEPCHLKARVGLHDPATHSRGSGQQLLPRGPLCEAAPDVASLGTGHQESR